MATIRTVSIGIGALVALAGGGTAVYQLKGNPTQVLIAKATPDGDGGFDIVGVIGAAGVHDGSPGIRWP